MCDLCAIKLELLTQSTFVAGNESFRSHFGNRKVVLVISEEAAEIGIQEIIDSLIEDNLRAHITH